MAVLSTTKKNKGIILPVKPYNPARKHMSKAEAIEDNKRIKERNLKIAEMNAKILAGEDIDFKKENDIEILEKQLESLISQASTAAAMADSPAKEKEAEKLMGQVKTLRMRIGRMKKKEKGK